MSSACVCHIDGAWCFYCEMYSPVVTENEHLKAELKAESLRAAEWEGEASGYAEENDRLTRIIEYVRHIYPIAVSWATKKAEEVSEDAAEDDE